MPELLEDITEMVNEEAYLAHPNDQDLTFNVYGYENEEAGSKHTDTEEAWGCKFTVHENEPASRASMVTRFEADVLGAKVSGLLSKPMHAFTAYLNDDEELVDSDTNIGPLTAHLMDVITKGARA